MNFADHEVRLRAPHPSQTACVLILLCIWLPGHAQVLPDRGIDAATASSPSDLAPRVITEGGDRLLYPALFSPDGEKLLVRSSSSLRVFFLENGRSLDYTVWPTAIAWGPDSNRFIAGFEIGVASTFDINAFPSMVQAYLIPYPNPAARRVVDSVALSPDMGRIAANSGSMYLLNALDGELIDKFAGGNNLSFLPDGIRIFHQFGTDIGVVDTVTKELTLSIKHASGSVTPDGSLLVTYAGQTEGQRTALLNPVTGEEVVAYPSTEGKRGFSAAPYENKLVRLEQDGNAVKVERWNRDGVIEDEAILTYDYPTPVRFTALSPDSRQMVTVTTDGIYLWNINQIATPVRDARVYGPE